MNKMEDTSVVCPRDEWVDCSFRIDSPQSHLESILSSANLRLGWRCINQKDVCFNVVNEISKIDLVLHVKVTVCNGSDR